MGPGPRSARDRLAGVARDLRAADRLRDVRDAVAEMVTLAGPPLHRTVLVLDYPPNAANVPRYREPHPGLDRLLAARESVYEGTLDTIGAYRDDLARIPVTEGDEFEPAWINGFLPGLDGAAIYALLRSRRPARYVEIGSGNSTRFAARARRDGQLRTTITSIDPRPRASIDALCDTVVREPLEAVDVAMFDQLAPGDVLFLDGSHRVFMNGDVVAFVLDVLPRLPGGVAVGVHDIYLPYDYPTDIAGRYYSEQYLLAAWLLGGADVEILLPAQYVSRRMGTELTRLWDALPELAGIERHGVAFWFQTRR